MFTTERAALAVLAAALAVIAVVMLWPRASTPDDPAHTLVVDSIRAAAAAPPDSAGQATAPASQAPADSEGHGNARRAGKSRRQRADSVAPRRTRAASRHQAEPPPRRSHLDEPLPGSY